MITLGIFMSIIFIVFTLGCIICCNNYLFNAVFERKSRKFWKFIIKNADRFEYVGSHELGKIFVWGEYFVVIWSDNTCSVHIDTSDRHECIVAHTDEVMANKMIKLLSHKIK